MTRPRNAAQGSHISMTQRSLLIGLGVVSSVGLLSGRVAQAEPEMADEAIAVPSATELLPIPAETPTAPAPTPQPIAAPEATPTPQSSTAAESAPAPASMAAPESSPQAEVPISPQLDLNNSYIDPTDYNLGATEAEQPTIVLTERATGCQAALQAGQEMSGNSICGAVQNRLQQQAAIANAPSSGGTADSLQGWVNAAAQAGSGSNSGRSFALSPASVQNFYNRTLRPLAALGNGNTRLLYPLNIPATITSAFGWRIHPIAGVRRFHNGTDIGAPQGTPVLAAFSGRVSTADFLGGYGLTVILTHDEGQTQTLYAHLSEVFVQNGEWVEQGEAIGRVGSTGYSTGPHLHFEYRENTPDGWVARDAGYTLQLALAQFLNGVQVTQLPLPKLTDWAMALDVQNLEDFGQFVSDVLPDVASKETAAAALSQKVDNDGKAVDGAIASTEELPEVVVPATIHP